MDKPFTHVVTHAPNEASSEPDLIAISLLKLQQRFDALDRLYNEEIGILSQELAQLKADYVRLFQSQPALPRRGNSSRRPSSRTRLKS